jgi:polysaccharide deacetylase 2 family uncharacterized protein YibQ
LRSSGSPQSILGLFGGPGFLVVCLLIVFIAGAIAYLALSGEHGTTGGATLSLPGGAVPPAQLSEPGNGTTGGTPAAGTQLQSMPSAPVAKETSVGFAIEEDLSPAELLAKYPPDPGAALVEGDGDLPAWQRFGRASTISRQAPRAALLITGLGRNRVDTVRAITGTPPETSLGFTADTPDLSAWIAAARAYGHEVLLDLPLDRPASADGLARERTPEENMRRLDALLARAPLVAGVAVSGGEPFLADAAALQPILKHAQTLGLAVVGLPVTAPLTIAADETILGDATQTVIGRSVEQVMSLAQRRGAALGVIDSTSAATLFPAWRRALVGRDEISLVPVTALVEE